jgi:hypothetical protein
MIPPQMYHPQQAIPPQSFYVPPQYPPTPQYVPMNYPQGPMAQQVNIIWNRNSFWFILYVNFKKTNDH